MWLTNFAFVESWINVFSKRVRRNFFVTVSEVYMYVRDFLFAVECSSKAKLQGKTVVITGGNTGIGKETALDLAQRGAKVIIGCRDIEKGEKAVKDILRVVQNATVIMKPLDLASFSSIKEFAGEVLRTEPRIHILINNAGVMACPKSKTVDGFEMHFGVNHLGHFLLTNLLLDRMKASTPARIVNVSSALYFFGKIRFDDINLDCGYNRFLAYCNSKLANMLFTRELAKRLKGTGVSAYCLHPGVIHTNLTRHMKSIAFGIITYLQGKLSKLILKQPRQGAQTTIFCAADESLAEESGLYYCACKSVKPLKKATDDDSAKALWKLSENFIDSVTNSPLNTISSNSKNKE